MNDQTLSINLDKLLAHTDDGVFVLDGRRRVVLFNPACERLTGFEGSEVIGSGCQCSDVVDCHDQQGRSLAGCLCPGYIVFQGERPATRQRMCITTKSGRNRWVETAYSPLPPENGSPGCIIGIMRDVSEAVAHEEEMRQSYEQMRQEVQRSQASPSESAGSVTPQPEGTSTRLDETLADVERQAILGALKNARGQRSLAAKLMGISRSRLYRRMEALGIATRSTL